MQQMDFRVGKRDEPHWPWVKRDAMPHSKNIPDQGIWQSVLKLPAAWMIGEVPGKIGEIEDLPVLIIRPGPI